MGKYDPLETFLQGQHGDRVSVKFSEVERVLGFKLPASKQYPAWWSNNPSNNPMTKTWLRAGYMTEQVDTAAERLVFRRTQPLKGGSAGATPRSGGFPGYGAMKGTVRLTRGVDLSAPADPEWASVFE
ncbi:hypothetical protein [Phenylobacterium sp.]|uniref:DUF7662 domain-containing protein n=1 Tax=Phenylobacterium sp. TaxID=1871053 RepID=UPI002723EEEE|nr:hypothetical protein [Phenylobacterium sp.]MDO8800248.1 hypothetical protein [Phenylobacterium sp.]